MGYATTNAATTNAAATNDATTNNATTKECNNEQFLSIKSGCHNEHMLQRTMPERKNATTNDATMNDAITKECYNERCYDEGMLQRKMLRRRNATMNDATTKECYNEQFLSIKSGCRNEHRCYNERGGIISADVARECAWRVGPCRFD